jgi:hypothetical protein
MKLPEKRVKKSYLRHLILTLITNTSLPLLFNVLLITILELISNAFNYLTGRYSNAEEYLNR